MILFVWIVPIKCFGEDDTSSSYVISAIYEAVDNYSCDVINMSLGVSRDLYSLRMAVDYAVSKGVLVVAAVGNDGTTDERYPAAYDSVIGVGSMNKRGSVSDFSQKNNSVFVSAPGEDIASLDYSSSTGCIRGDGTSFAAPYAAAAAIFLKQYNKNATVEDFKNILISSVNDAGMYGYDTSYGHGVINFANFVTEAESYQFDSISSRYTDISGHWARQSMAFCLNNGYFTGTSDTLFEPQGVMSRGMFVTVLSRMSGENISGYPNRFTDVPNSQYYAQPCGWGSATGIVEGASPTTFEPNANVTREQIAALLYRYALKYELTQAVTGTSLGGFTDASAVSEYAVEAMSWAIANGIIEGRTDTTIVPRDSALRCEVATMVERFANRFTD